MDMNGISINYSERFNFPFGLISCGEILLDKSKVGSFAYNEQEGDYILLINPGQEQKFKERIELYFNDNFNDNRKCEYDIKEFFNIMSEFHNYNI